MKNSLNIKSVYFNSNSKKRAFEYLKKQKYLKYSKIKKFIYNNFLDSYPFGYIIVDKDEKIRGFLGTMFSRRSDLNNNNSLYCNLHTWIVDDDIRLRFFSEAKDLLKPIFENESIIFARPVLSLIRLFERNFDISVKDMNFRLSLLFNLKNFLKNTTNIGFFLFFNFKFIFVLEYFFCVRVYFKINNSQSTSQVEFLCQYPCFEIYL